MGVSFGQELHAARPGQAAERIEHLGAYARICSTASPVSEKVQRKRPSLCRIRLNSKAFIGR